MKGRIARFVVLDHNKANFFLSCPEDMKILSMRRLTISTEYTVEHKDLPEIDTKFFDDGKPPMIYPIIKRGMDLMDVGEPKLEWDWNLKGSK